jgi:hypothetical protein
MTRRQAHARLEQQCHDVGPIPPAAHSRVFRNKCHVAAECCRERIGWPLHVRGTWIWDVVVRLAQTLHWWGHNSSVVIVQLLLLLLCMGGCLQCQLGFCVCRVDTWTVLAIVVDSISVAT